MKKVVLTFIGAATMFFAHAQEPVCDSTSSEFTYIGLRESGSGDYLSCEQQQFILEVPATGNISWYKDGANRGGGNPFYVNEAGMYTAYHIISNDECVKYGAFEIKRGEKPVVSLDYSSRFFCKDSLGAELGAITDSVSDQATFQWFKNGGELDGQTGDSVIADENASYFVEVNDQGCVGRSAQVQIQEKNCAEIVCPELALKYDGLIELSKGTYRICGDEYRAEVVAETGSMNDMYIEWTVNGQLISETNILEGDVTGNVKVKVFDNLVCEDSLEFVIENGDVSRVQILNKKDGEIIFCLGSGGADLEAQSNPELGFVYKWYLLEQGSYVMIDTGRSIVVDVEGEYKVVIGTLECDSISSDEVSVVAFDCEANCFALELKSNELYQLEDTSYSVCRNSFSMNIESSISDLNQATVKWYFEGDEFAMGKYVNVSKSAKYAAGVYKVVAEEVGVCVDEFEFTITNDPVAKVKITEGPYFMFCEDEKPSLEAEIYDTVPNTISNFYASWYFKTNGQWQNSGGGFSLNNVQAGMYKIELNGDACTNISSDSIEVIYEDICAPLAIEELASLVKLVPNPASDFVTVVGLESVTKVLVYNTQGVVVLSSTQATIDVSNLISAVYTVEIVAENQVIRLPLVK